MINNDMRAYNFYVYGDDDGYGQPALSIDPKGIIKMAINISNQTVQDNILYKDCAYIGLTNDAIDDSYVIDYNGEKLKVLYVNPKGRFKQVFLKGM